jgi:hypothetical protein
MSVNRFAHSNENAAFPFPRYNCKCSIKEVSEMSKYIPKVGDIVLSGLGEECKVLHVGNKSLFVECGSSEFAVGFDYFKPIPTKADIEREKLEVILGDYAHAQIRLTTIEIQKAGFTIPKKVKRSDISNAIALYFPMGFGAGNNLTIDICNLLGDLIQD